MKSQRNSAAEEVLDSTDLKVERDLQATFPKKNVVSNSHSFH
jgi:chorismate mutase